MSRWKQVVRGMLGMGLTFGGISAAFFTALTVVAALFGGGLDPTEPFFPIIAGTVWGFGIGVAFSGVLAIAGRHLSFEKLTVPRVAGIGAAGGLILAGALVGIVTLTGDGFAAIDEAFMILPILGAGAGTASLLIARKASPALRADDGPGELGDGGS